jgi:hypothetical protein
VLRKDVTIREDRIWGFKDGLAGLFINEALEAIDMDEELEAIMSDLKFRVPYPATLGSMV